MPGPTDAEQLMLELVNETRLDPLANAARYISNYAVLTSPDRQIQSALDYFDVNGAALLTAYSALVPTGPLAWNDALGTAAEKHSAAMITAQTQSHQVAGELSLGERVKAEGYAYSYLGENVYAYASSVLFGHAGFMVDWGNGPDGMQSPAGHRNNIMSANFTEIGIDITAETSTTNPLGPLVITEDLGTRGKNFVLGVAYSDRDGNAFYSVGDGRADLTVTVAARTAVSTSSGGYTVEAARGAVSVQLSGGGLSSAVTVTAAIGTENLKLDVVDGHIIQTSASAVLAGSGADVLRGLGMRGLVLTTGTGAQTIEGTRGNDTIDGGSGADRLVGGAGDDLYRADNQGDLVVEALNGGTDTVIAAASFYLTAYVERLTLGAGASFGVGNGLANLITGNDGENLLIGGGGDDELRGGDARDSLFGEDGADTLLGEAGIDFLVGGAGADLIDGGTEADEIHGEDGNDTLVGGAGFVTDILVGGGGNDTLRGDSGLGDYDRLYGGIGDDAFHVDTPDDLVFEQAGEGTDTVFAGIVGAGFYLYDNVENLVLTGATPFGVGNALANQLTGNAAANYLLGGAGNDTLNGKAGADVLFGQAGADVFVFDAGTGADVIADFEPGTDRIQLVGGYASFAEAQAHFVQNGAHGAIDLGGGDIVVLHNTVMNQLTAADFLFG